MRDGLVIMNTSTQPQNNIQIARDQLVAQRKRELLAERQVNSMVKQVANATNSSEIYKALEWK